MARSVLLSALVFCVAFASCGGEQTVERARKGMPCGPPNAKAIGENGCDLCSCIGERWSCEEGDCTCSPGESRLQFDGCTICPCENGKFLCKYKPCLACPPPRTDLSCTPFHVWARDPDSGLCCDYDKPCEASLGWQTYGSAGKCNPLGCICDDTPDAALQPIGCGCPLDGCPTLTDALAKPCENWGIAVIERRGCGKVELSSNGGFTGWTSLFDEQTGTMIGKVEFADQTFGACNRFGYEFGERLDCADVVACLRCPGDSLEPLPACSP